MELIAAMKSIAAGSPYVYLSEHSKKVAIDAINWTKMNVNDIFLSLDSNEVFQQNLGKIVIHRLAGEIESVFAPARTDARLRVAFLSALITKELINDSFLLSKQSTNQQHVSINPRKIKEIKEFLNL